MLMSRMMQPTVREARLRIDCATALGWKPSCWIAFSTFARISGVTEACPFSTRETDPSETPAALATSRMVSTDFLCPAPSLVRFKRPRLAI